MPLEAGIPLVGELSRVNISDGVLKTVSYRSLISIILYFKIQPQYVFFSIPFIISKFLAKGKYADAVETEFIIKMKRVFISWDNIQTYCSIIRALFYYASPLSDSLYPHRYLQSMPHLSLYAINAEIPQRCHDIRIMYNSCPSDNHFSSVFPASS